MDKVLIIGYGKLGSHLYYALKKTRRFKFKIVKNSPSKPNTSVVNNANIIFICTQDSKIKNAVKKLTAGQYLLKNKFICHTSGSLTSLELEKLSKKGAYIGSFHPVQTFEKKTGKDSGRFKDIYIAVEGNPKAVKKGFQIARLIKSKPFEISKDNKIYHHICCVIASNFLSVLMRQIEKIGTRKIRINGFK